MKLEFDTTKMVEEITMQVEETQEEFIFKTIFPYCENILQMNINKEELKQILLNGKRNIKHGHWIVHPKGIYAHLVCDQCLSGAPYDCKTNFCSNCGADMRVTRESKKNYILEEDE